MDGGARTVRVPGRDHVPVMWEKQQDEDESERRGPGQQK